MWPGKRKRTLTVFRLTGKKLDCKRCQTDSKRLSQAFKRIPVPFKQINKSVKRLGKVQKRNAVNVKWLQNFLNGKLRTLNGWRKLLNDHKRRAQNVERFNNNLKCNLSQQQREQVSVLSRGQQLKPLMHAQLDHCNYVVASFSGNVICQASSGHWGSSFASSSTRAVIKGCNL